MSKLKIRRLSAFWQAVATVVVAYLLLKYAFPPLMPLSLMIQDMIIIVLFVLVYFSYDDARWTEFKKPILAMLRDDDKTVIRWAFLLIVPGVVGYVIYGLVKPTDAAPVELRQVHPAPPASLRVFNKTYKLTNLENPLREQVLEEYKSNPETAWKSYETFVEEGREVYYRNCVFCHGDLLDGGGIFASAFSPIPANFQDVGTIAQLQESYLFWRITTGGPGLPKEGTPWNSAMPVWQEILKEGEVWRVIMFLFDYVGHVPRIWDQDISKVVTSMKDEVSKRRARMKGEELFIDRCMVCHGNKGAGDGPAADFFNPRPRDFTLGLFKYKTTPGTMLPSDDNLFNTIKFGLPGSGMPGWRTLLSDEQIRSLIPVIKSFDIAGAWAPEDAPEDDFDEDGRYLKTDFLQFTETEPVASQIPFSEESAAKGKKIFEEICGKCHGLNGRGNITSDKKLEDDWGARIWPRDLTLPHTWRVSNVRDHEGERRQDEIIRRIYQRFSIGIPGTPMPAQRSTQEGEKDAIGQEDRWHVANYVFSLRNTKVQLSKNQLIRGKKVEGVVPSSIDDPAWETTPATTLPFAANIIKEGRLHTPMNVTITVRTLYDDKDIAFLLEVNDRTDSRPGEPTATQLHDTSLQMHSDAFAIQFPHDNAFKILPAVEKPLFRHGDARHSTTIWYWNAGSIKPEAAPKTVLFDATGPNEKLIARSDDNSISADGKWNNGQWRVIMTRPRSPENGDMIFEEGKYMPISFANWDGNNGEIGSRHTLTAWFWLLLPKAPDILMVYGMPTGTTLLVFLGCLGLVRNQRRRTK